MAECIESSLIPYNDAGTPVTAGKRLALRAARKAEQQVLANLRGIDGSETGGLDLAKHWNGTIRALRELEKYVFAYWCSYRLFNQQQHSAGLTVANSLQLTAFAMLNWKWATASQQCEPVRQLIHKVGASGAKEAIGFNPKFPDDGSIDALCAQHGLRHSEGFFDVAGPGYPQDLSYIQSMMREIAGKSMPSLTNICGKLHTVKGKPAYSHPPSTYDKIHNSDGTTVLHTYVVPVRDTGADQIDGDLCIERLISNLTGTRCMHTIDEIIGHCDIKISDPDNGNTTRAQIFAVKWLKYPGHDSWHPREDLDPVAVDEYCRS